MACLAEGKGDKSHTVTDVQKGLCTEHAKGAAGRAYSAFREPEPRRMQRRTTHRPVEVVTRITTPTPLLNKERFRRANINRMAKVAILREASRCFDGKPESMGKLVDKAVELLEKNEVFIERSSLYSFVSGKLTAEERVNLGLKQKQAYIKTGSP